MPRGRRSEPAELKALKGNPGKRPVPQAPAAAAASAIKPSSKLGGAAMSIWRELAPDLERMNLLRPTDRHAFSRYCGTLAEYWDVTAKLKASGVTYETDTLHGKMQRINPLFLVQDRLVKRLTDAEDRFGLSPASRQSIMARLAALQPSLPLNRPPDESASATAGTVAPLASPIGLLGDSMTRH